MNYCDKCGRFMGDIDEPICHQCEVAEVDAARHPIDCDCRECEPEPVDAEERYIHED